MIQQYMPGKKIIKITDVDPVTSYKLDSNDYTFRQEDGESRAKVGHEIKDGSSVGSKSSPFKQRNM